MRLSKTTSIIILVTGATGLLGRKLIPSLLKRGFKIIACARRPSKELNRFFKKGFIFEKCDLTSGKNVDRLFKKYNFDQVIHLAASMKRGKVSIAEGLAMFEQNVISTLNIIFAARNRPLKKFIFSSSMAVYGRPKYLPVDEQHPLYPLDFYGATKVISESLIRHFGSGSFQHYFILRFPSLFLELLKEGALYNFVKKAKRGLDLVITAADPCPWDILHIEDAAAIIRACILSKRKGGIFNADYGKKINLDSMARHIKKICHSPSRIVKIHRVRHPYFYFDNTEIKKKLGLRLPALETRLREYTVKLKSD